MKCLLCEKELGKSSLRDILFCEDLICEACRKKWDKRKISFHFEGIRVDSDYVYNEAFSKCLIQYKECCDEALKDVFLYQVRKKLRRRYRGYTLVMMPSSNRKMEERGFSHLQKIFEALDLPILEPFAKKEDLSQKKMHRKERERMAHEIFLSDHRELPKKIVLCDDTITTGATLKGALNCIDQSKHKVRIYAVSVNASWVKD